jgi:hypothetical protein
MFAGFLTNLEGYFVKTRTFFVFLVAQKVKTI